MITWENYEEYMVMHADGELSPAQEQELMSFLYEHPGLQSELTAFTMTKMIPDAAETYTRKESLLKPVPAAEKPKVIAFPVWRRYAVAAGLAALLFGAAYKLWFPATHTDGIAGAKTTPAATAPANPVTMPPATDLPAHPLAQAERTNIVPDVPTTAPARKTVDPNTRVPRRRTVVTAHGEATPAMAVVTIDKLQAGDVKELEATQKNIAPDVTNVPALAIQYREDEIGDEGTAGSLIDRLPISDTKKTGMKTLASDVANGYSKVNSIGQEIARTNVSVSLRKKQLILSF